MNTRGRGRFVWILALVALPHLAAAQSFTQSTTFCRGAEHTTAIALGDIDRDGDLDVIFGNGRHLPEADWVFYNNGRGDFYGSRPLENEPDRTYGVALGDLDGDGALDVVVANDAGNRAFMYRNDGKGNFILLERGLGLGREARRGVALGDLDGDGDLDIVLVGPGQDHVYMNDGADNWTGRALGPGTDYSLSVAIADLDGDRDLDIVVGNRDQLQNVVYVNDGRGGFGESRPFGTNPEQTVSIALGDVDGDGDIDIVAGNWAQSNAIYLNNGRAVFTESRAFGNGSEQTWSVALGDMDLDGDLDVVAGIRGVNTIQIDSDGDGRPDRWVDENRNEPGRVYVNDGRGVFTAGSPFGTGNDMTRPIALGDLDGDGDLDIVMGNDCRPNTVFFNSLRTPTARGRGAPLAAATHSAARSWRSKSLSAQVMGENR